MITRNSSTTTAATAATAAAALAALAWRRRRARSADTKAMAILAARNARMHSTKAIRHGRAFDVRASDVFVVTYPKCGTTWVSAIAHFLRGGDEDDFGEIGEVMPWDIIALDCGQNCNDEQIRSPRLFKSHETYDKIAKGGKYVYVSREPADALVSFYKFLPAYMHAPPMSIEAFCAGVFGGLSHSGGVWAHLCGWWARRRDANVCWVCYETLRAHPEREIARIARFMGVPADAATVARVAARTSLAAMRAAGPKYDDHFVFHRLKGQIGIAGEHQASKVRTGAVGRGAALPASVRRMLEARWRDTVFRRTGLASYGELRAVAAREAATPSATRSPRGSYDADGLAELAPPRPQATRGPSGSYDCGDVDELPPAGPTPTRGPRGSYDDNSDFEDDIANLTPPDSPAPDSPIDRAIADARADIHDRVEQRVAELGEDCQ